MDWVKVYSANDEVQVELVNAVMHREGIETKILDKKDSAVVVLGQVEIYVPKKYAERARKLIEEDEEIPT